MISLFTILITLAVRHSHAERNKRAISTISPNIK